MSDPAPPPKAPAQAHSDSKDHGPKHIIVRPYPKIVFLYPTMLFSLVAGILLGMQRFKTDDTWVSTIAFIFFAIFAINLLTIAFEFNRFSTIAIVLFLFALSLSLILLNQHYNIFQTLGKFYEYLRPSANSHFFYMIFAIHLFIYIGVFIDSRFDYWEFRPNEILHKHGFLGDVKRYPAPGTQVTKEITDVLEYMLLLSGRLVIFPPGADRPIVLDNVVRINAVEERVMKLLSSLSVTVDHKHPHSNPNQGIS